MTFAGKAVATGLPALPKLALAQWALLSPQPPLPALLSLHSPVKQRALLSLQTPFPALPKLALASAGLG